MSQLEKISKKLSRLQKYNLTYGWIFGLYVNKKQNEDGDIDIIVKT